MLSNNDLQLYTVLYIRSMGLFVKWKYWSSTVGLSTAWSLLACNKKSKTIRKFPESVRNFYQALNYWRYDRVLQKDNAKVLCATLLVPWAGMRSRLEVQGIDALFYFDFSDFALILASFTQLDIYGYCLQYNPDNSTKPLKKISVGRQTSLSFMLGFNYSDWTRKMTITNSSQYNIHWLIPL